MLIAQTGSNTVAPLAEPQGSPAASNLWWMLPVAVAIVALAAYLRLRKSVPQPPAKFNKNSERKSATRGSATRVNVATSDTAVKDSRTQDRPQSASSDTRSAKKKKSSKKKSQQTAKQTATPTAVASVSSAGKIAALDSTAAVAAPTNTAKVSKEITESKPVNAIFEPMRDAVKARKRQKFEEEPADAFESNDDSRQPDLVSQLFGGKFERMVPKANIRSYANRWPAPAAQQVKLTPAVAERPQPIAAPIPEAVNVPVTSAPEMGLKSFVSKVTTRGAE